MDRLISVFVYMSLCVNCNGYVYLTQVCEQAGECVQVCKRSPYMSVEHALEEVGAWVACRGTWVSESLIFSFYSLRGGER